MDTRGWNRPRLQLAANLSSQVVHNLLTDGRDSLGGPPTESTVQGLARAFGLKDTVVWVAVADAMGLPTAAVPSIVDELRSVTDEDLIGELTSRLSRRAVTDAEYQAIVEREGARGIEHLFNPHEFEVDGRELNHHPPKSIAWRRYERQRKQQEDNAGLMLAEQKAARDVKAPSEARNEKHTRYITASQDDCSMDPL